LSYGGFMERGFSIEVVFDSDPAKIGRVIAGRRCFDIEEAENVLKERPVEIAILACNLQGIQEVVDRFIACGVKSFLSFVPAIINAPDRIYIETEDISAKLEKLSFLVKNRPDNMPDDANEKRS
ncbi:MAG TPA: hypothetical protein VLL97_14150, partial [Acidobacteriota bacterium]|nr:hypothetical protein [Acidobacteriota bacterium]